MGYRPSIYLNDEFIVEFGKFYGYVDHRDLKSIIWLEDHGKIEPRVVPTDEPGYLTFLGGYGPRIEFTADEFREFWDLYIQDINEHDFTDDGIVYPKPYDPEETWKQWSDAPGTFKEVIYDTNEPKIIEWG